MVGFLGFFSSGLLIAWSAISFLSFVFSPQLLKLCFCLHLCMAHSKNRLLGTGYSELFLNTGLPLFAWLLDCYLLWEAVCLLAWKHSDRTDGLRRCLVRVEVTL